MSERVNVLTIPKIPTTAGVYVESMSYDKAVIPIKGLTKRVRL